MNSIRPFSLASLFWPWVCSTLFPLLAICPTHKIKRSGCVSMRYMFDGGGNGENRLEGGIYDGWWPSAPITPASLNIVRPPTSLSLSLSQQHLQTTKTRSVGRKQIFFFSFEYFGPFSHGGTHLHIVKLKEHTQKGNFSLSLEWEPQESKINSFFFFLRLRVIVAAAAIRNGSRTVSMAI